MAALCSMCCGVLKTPKTYEGVQALVAVCGSERLAATPIRHAVNGAECYYKDALNC